MRKFAVRTTSLIDFFYRQRERRACKQTKLTGWRHPEDEEEEEAGEDGRHSKDVTLDSL